MFPGFIAAEASMEGRMEIMPPRGKLFARSVGFEVNTPILDSGSDCSGRTPGTPVGSRTGDTALTEMSEPKTPTSPDEYLANAFAAQRKSSIDELPGRKLRRRDVLHMRAQEFLFKSASSAAERDLSFL